MRAAPSNVDIIASMNEKKKRDEDMALIRSAFEPWQPGEWDEFRETLNRDKAAGAEAVSYIAAGIRRSAC